jgi:hypothetical protein
MALRPFSLWQRALYGTLALAVAAAAYAAPAKKSKAKAASAKPKPGPTAPAAEHDPLTEWELVNGAAIELRAKIGKEPKSETLRQSMAELAVRSAIGAERALAIGDATLFDSYRTQFREQFHDTRWRLGNLAEKGSGAAAYAAGVVEVHGFLAAADVAAACRSFRDALARGYAGAKFRVSQCLEKDDAKQAAAMLREAASSGHPAAAELVGRRCLEARPQDAPCAWDNLTLAASAGRPSAQSVLAWMYAQGTGGRAADPGRALRLYQQAAKAGDASAQNNLGELYETGRGMPADPAVALTWYRKAAEGGFPPGQFNLGRLYAGGLGVLKDPIEARKWLELAERGGIATARQLLDWLDKENASK